MINVYCLKWGTKYDRHFVEDLKNKLSKHLTVDHSFFCFTDTPEKEYDIKIENNLPHVWNKLSLLQFSGDSLYFDLDVVITDNIDSFFTYEKDSKVVLMRDFNPTTKGFNSSIMRFNNEIMTPYVWKPYLKEKKKFNRLQGDQNVITDCLKQVPDKFKIYPDEWTFSAKWYDRSNPRFKRSQWNFKQYPGAKVAVFHGKPDPLQLVDVHPHESYDMDTIAWVKKHWK